MADSSKFEQWAIVELMGHQRMAGFVTEATIGGATLLRIDVPAVEGHEAYTRYIAPSALYAINPTSEANARAAAKAFRPRPVQDWELPRALPEPTPPPARTGPVGVPADDLDDDEHETPW